MDISVIGFGSFGQFAVKHLSSRAKISVYDSVDRTEIANKLGVSFVSLKDACKNRVIFLAVPMERLESVLIHMRPLVRPDAVVIDVCSLKGFAADLMLKHLPSTVELIGTHPLFGPQSAKDSIIGCKIVLCEVRCRPKVFAEMKTFCNKLGMETIVSTSQEHDRQMASSQALTHFICQVILKMKVERVAMSTKTFDRLMDIVDVIKSDSPQLFSNMQTLNPHAKEMRRSFIKTCQELDKDLK